MKLDTLPVPRLDCCQVVAPLTLRRAQAISHAYQEVREVLAMLEEARQRLQLIEAAQRHLRENLDAIAGRLVVAEAELSAATPSLAQSPGQKAAKDAPEAPAQS
ncbi:MAG: hypothetical protein ACE5JN_02565 [Candidatus Methylomirabilia bacterium]